MSIQELLRELRAFNRSALAMAALGAELSLRKSGEDGDPQTRALLQDVVRGIGLDDLSALTQEQQAMALGVIRLFLGDVADMFERPAPAPGWTHTDVQTLEAQGQVSRGLVGRIDAMASERPDLAAVLRGSGRFLDVGTGVGHLAIAAARTWPAYTVVGIEVWEPAVARARENVAGSGVADRIELRSQNVADLTDVESFNLAWFPAPFISRAVVESALPRVYDALVPGGWVVVGQHEIPADPLGQALVRLQVVRSGGYPWTVDEMTQLLRSCGYSDVEAIEGAPGVTFMIGRKTVEIAS